MSAGAAQRVRCAIYTRKSSEEGLEQGFNSLDAQREACAAYVLSQASEGWAALPDRYDDGGISGGTLERPALKRLVADVEAGKIDVIVVYKVDRLSRSLFDFAKLVEAFEKAGTSFVSITQSFNTTSSMGRLTLNMLLSFAQFEREVTAERIRDKIAASKAKGMWMGGVPPLGYAPDGRSLAIIEEQATLVRLLFAKALELGTVGALQEWLDDKRMRLPRRTLAMGRVIGGGRYERGPLYAMLRNRLYVGEIVHRGATFAGQHLPIVDRETFDRVQLLLTENRQGRTYRRAASPALLAGRIVDRQGVPLLCSHASKGMLRYHYYVSRDRQRGVSQYGLRLPTSAIERPVVDRILALFADPLALMTDLGLKVDDLELLGDKCAHLRALPRASQAQTLLSLVEKVQVGDEQLVVQLDRARLAELLEVQAGCAAAPITLAIDGQFRRGRTTRLVTRDGHPIAPSTDPSLTRLIAKAHGWWAELRKGEMTLTDLAGRESVTASYVTRVLRLAFLSPPIIEAALAGRLRDGIDGTSLTLKLTISPDWREQDAMIRGPA
ncbi:recombinase family protein [Sphingomonas nostoxanthinifaciens]|uniref:recombinase family protein n=1 Tax=Sphingomonas nostoxanthinifaciens TaxID=2872652 RepID=UPI001CC20C67|nr:recombinase family protein [Sphingomonas nostoxanthinifaciens]UAK25602.1 recombinase family protein [Sphingomonas nostoxanthinifaciens]